MPNLNKSYKIISQFWKERISRTPSFSTLCINLTIVTKIHSFIFWFSVDISKLNFSKNLNAIPFALLLKNWTHVLIYLQPCLSVFGEKEEETPHSYLKFYCWNFSDNYSIPNSLRLKHIFIPNFVRKKSDNLYWYFLIVGQ